MLTKKQLLDATNCWFGNCEECSCNGLQKERGAFDCMMQVIETALEYMELAEKRKAMLERLEWSFADPNQNYNGRILGYCPVCVNHEKQGHVPDCELAALLKESEGEEG